MRLQRAVPAPGRPSIQRKTMSEPKNQDDLHEFTLSVHKGSIVLIVGGLGVRLSTNDQGGQELGIGMMSLGLMLEAERRAMDPHQLLREIQPRLEESLNAFLQMRAKYQQEMHYTTIHGTEGQEENHETIPDAIHPGGTGSGLAHQPGAASGQ